MNIKITPKPLNGSINAVTSKSAAHRLLICAAFADKAVSVTVDDLSEDINATVNCLSSMGANINIAGNGSRFDIKPIRLSEVREDALLNCGESGSTLRLILPLIAAAGKNITVTGGGTIIGRPMKELIVELEKNGAEFSSRELPYTVSVGLKCGTFHLPGNVSSGYFSGLMFALPLLSGDSEIILLSPPESVGYIDMTVKTLNMFGAEIKPTPNGWLVKGGQIYKSPETAEVEKDWSNAAFFLTAGAISESGVRVKGLDINSAQGDKKIIELLKNFGADIAADEKSREITVKKGNLHAQEIDVSNIPDLLPILAVLGAFAEGRTVLYNAERLRLKESDRLASTADMLNAFGFCAETEHDKLIITGNKRREVKEIVTESYNDHRMVMSAAIAASGIQRSIIIKNTEAVKKSYPAFFEDYKKLGGEADVV